MSWPSRSVRTSQPIGLLLMMTRSPGPSMTRSLASTVTPFALVHRADCGQYYKRRAEATTNRPRFEALHGCCTVIIFEAAMKQETTGLKRHGPEPAHRVFSR